MGAPHKPHNELCLNRVDLLLSDGDFDWFSIEAKRRRLPRATLARLLIIDALKKLEDTLPKPDSS